LRLDYTWDKTTGAPTRETSSSEVIQSNASTSLSPVGLRSTTTDQLNAGSSSSSSV